MKTKTISFRKIMILSFFVLATVLLSYIVLMYTFVSNTKKLSILEKEISLIQTNITQTEQELIVHRRSINKIIAEEAGFVPSSDIAYVRIEQVKTAFLND